MANPDNTLAEREGIELILGADSPHVFPSTLRKYPEISGTEPKLVLLGDNILDDHAALLDKTRPLRRVLEEKVQDDPGHSNIQVINLAVPRMETYNMIKRTPLTSSWETYETSRRQTAKRILAPLIKAEEKEEKKEEKEEERMVFKPKDEIEREKEAKEKVKEEERRLVNPMDMTYDYCVAEDGNIYSIENLRFTKEVKYVALSIGGNDALREARNLFKLVGSVIPYFRVWRHLYASDFNARLRILIHEIRDAAPEALIIPIIFYHPHYEAAGKLLKRPVKAYLKDILTPMARSYLFVAQELGLPVIDLSQTFDPSNIRHYSTMSKKVEGRTWSGMEPSDVSQNFIAELIKCVAYGYQPLNGPLVYYGRTHGDTLEKIVYARNTPEYAESYVFSKGGDESNTSASRV